METSILFRSIFIQMIASFGVGSALIYLVVAGTHASLSGIAGFLIYPLQTIGRFPHGYYVSLALPGAQTDVPAANRDRITVAQIIIPLREQAGPPGRD